MNKNNFFYFKFLNKTWLAPFVYNCSFKFLEIYYYLFFFLNLNKFLFNNKNLFFNKFFIFLHFNHSVKNKNFKFNLKLMIKDQFFSKNTANTVFFKKTNFIFKIKNLNPTFNINPSFSFFNKKNNKFYFDIFGLFCFFDYSSFNNKFNPHHLYNLIAIKEINKNILILDINKFFHRWKNTYFFIFNLFYYEHRFLFFGTNDFKKEIYSLNWALSSFDSLTWKYVFPFFTYKNNKFDYKFNYFLNKLKLTDVHFIFINDSHYHFKNLFYFNKAFFFTIGLSPMNMNPTLLSHPIVVFSNNSIIEYLFIKILIYIKKNSLFFKYLIYKKYYLNFQFYKNYWLF